MTRGLLLVPLIAVPLTAAPLPDAERERQEVRERFGAWTDPLGDCTYRAAGGRVAVRLPEYPRAAIEYHPGPGLCPRFVRTVDGDFTASVRVEVPPQPDARLDNRQPGGEARYLAAGLTAEDAHGNRAGVRRFEKREGGHRTIYGAAWRRAGGGGGGMGSGGKEADPRLYLRLSRQGATVVFAVSPDGATWREYGKQEIGWTGPVTVGLIAENSTGVPVEVTFDRFTLTQPKK